MGDLPCHQSPAPISDLLIFVFHGLVLPPFLFCINTGSLGILFQVMEWLLNFYLQNGSLPISDQHTELSTLYMYLDA